MEGAVKFLVMKHLFLIAIIIGLGILTKAQSEYEVSSDGTNKILKGLVGRDMLEKDSAFKWFHQNQAGYTPNTETVSVLKAKGPQVQFIVFGGTWCDDTKYLLPKFYSLLDAASFTSDQVTLIMVDHHKRSVDHASYQYAHLYCNERRKGSRTGRGIWKEWAMGARDRRNCQH